MNSYESLNTQHINIQNMVKKGGKKNSSAKKSSKTSKKKTSLKKTTKPKKTTKQIRKTKKVANLKKKSKAPKTKKVVKKTAKKTIKPSEKNIKQELIPDLPPLDDFDFDEVPQAPAEVSPLESLEIPEVPEPELPDPEKKEKKSWLKRIFSRKKPIEEKIDEDKEQKNQEDLLEGFKQDSEDYFSAKEESPERKEQIYVENMKRRADQEIRERHKHIDEKHKEVNEKEAELQKREEELNAREFEVSKKDSLYQEMVGLKEEVENLKISLDYQKQRVEELKSELAIKDAELREKEIELDRREEALKKAEAIKQHELALTDENKKLKTQISEEDDAIEYLQREIERQRQEFEDKMLALDVSISDEHEGASEIKRMITECYVDVSQNNLASAKQGYAKIRNLYLQEKKNDRDGSLYKEILRLYDDIKKQIAINKKN